MSSRRRLERSASSHRKKGDPEARFRIVPQPTEKPVILTHATVEDLGAYMPEVRGTYYAAVKSGMQDPMILVVHRMSSYAKRHGLDA